MGRGGRRNRGRERAGAGMKGGTIDEPAGLIHRPRDGQEMVGPAGTGRERTLRQPSPGPPPTLEIVI